MEDAKPDHRLVSWAFDDVADETIEELFPWQKMSPDEFAARHSHSIGCYSLHLRRYRNPEIGKWARRLGEILCSTEEMDRLRRQFLSREEYAKVQEEIDNIMKYGL